MTSLIVLVLSWLLCASIGVGIASFALPRGWRRERLLLAPVLGAGILVLLSASASYMGLTMRAAAPMVGGLGLGLSALCAIAARRRGGSGSTRWGAALFVHALGLAGGLAALLSVLLYHAWNPYNDAFTYITIADYLQGHSFFTPAAPTPMQPLLTQMWIYQVLGFRMGSNFLLAFFAALFRMEYAFDVYIPVLSLALWLAVPGFWILCRRALLMSPPATAVAATIYALHTAVPLTNALWGFMPQAWGMAFVFPLFALHIRAGSGGDRARRVVVAGLFGAMVLLTYTEIVPFALLGVGMCYLVRLVRGRLRFGSALVAGAGPIVLAIVLAPVAAWGFVTAIRTQSGAVVGWDPHLSLFEYLGVLAGYRSIALNVMTMPGFEGAVCRLASIAAIVTALSGAVGAWTRTTRQAMYIGSGFLLALAWFGLWTVNPWNPSQVGQPWSTYKVVTYGCFLFVALWAVGLVAFWRRGGLLRPLVAAQLGMFVAFFPVASVVTARVVSRDIRALTGNTQDPVGEYKRVVQLVADQPADQPVNLKFPVEALKHRQMVAYFLRRPVIADWSEDVYIGPHLGQARSLQLDPRYSTLVYTPSTPSASTPTTANLTLNRDLALLVETDFGSGWHAQEREGAHWWRWLEQEGHMQVTVHHAGWLTMHTELAVVGAPSREVTVALTDYPDRTSTYKLSERWFTPFMSDRIRVEPGSYQIAISGDGPPKAMSATDARIVRVGVKDLSWILTPDEPK